MPIRHKRTTTTGYSWQSGDTVEGQIGLNLTDGTLHFKKSNGTYVKVGDTTGFGTGNGTVTSVAALTLGTAGTDVASTVANGSTTPVITLNIPTASATNRGALSSTDWSTFNGKQAALTSGTNIKTVNSTTLLGSGNLSVGTVTSVGGTGTVAGLTLTGTVTSTGNLTLGGTLSVNLGSQVTSTLPIANGGTGGTTARDAWDNLTTYTATNSASVSLTNASNYIQHVYGGSGTTFTLPSTSTMTFGEGFYIINNSGQTTTVNTSTSALVGTIPTGGAMRLHVTNTGSNAATSWFALRDIDSITGTGSAVLATNPTISAPTISGAAQSTGSLVLKDIRETVFAIGNSGTSTLTPDAANGSIQTITATGNFTLSAFSNPVSGQSITFIITQDGTGSRTLTSTMKFAGGSKTLSTAANAIDILTVSYIGTTYYASLAKGFA